MKLIIPTIFWFMVFIVTPLWFFICCVLFVVISIFTVVDTVYKLIKGELR
jgi:hypothetical protein